MKPLPPPEMHIIRTLAYLIPFGPGQCSDEEIKVWAAIDDYCRNRYGTWAYWVDCAKALIEVPEDEGVYRRVSEEEWLAHVTKPTHYSNIEVRRGNEVNRMYQNEITSDGMGGEIVKSTGYVDYIPNPKRYYIRKD
jgi:hypothetical protein